MTKHGFLKQRGTRQCHLSHMTPGSFHAGALAPEAQRLVQNNTCPAHTASVRSWSFLTYKPQNPLLKISLPLTLGAHL